MLRSYRAWLAGALLLCVTSTLVAQQSSDRYGLSLPDTQDSYQSVPAQNTPAPPEWNDGASVYLNTHNHTGQCEQASQCDASAGTCSGGTCSINVGTPRGYSDPRVAQAAYQQDDRLASNEAPKRRLAPPSDAARADAGRSSTAADVSAGWDLPLDSLVTTLTALVLVIGLFLLCMWALRRGSRTVAGQLPQDAVRVLGSLPLAGRQIAQLLRVGDKLVLISVTPSGAQPLAEVSDPAEVDRLSGLCLAGGLRSAPPVHEKAQRHLPTEPTLGNLPKFDLPLAKAPSPPDLFRAYQGGERA